MSTAITYTTRLDDGTLLTGAGTVWQNVTTTAVSAEVQADPPRPNPRFRRDREPGRENPIMLAPNYYVLRPDGILGREPWRRGEPCPRLVIAPGQRVVLPEDLDEAVQRTKCEEPGCPGRPYSCRNAKHRRGAVIGGLAWSLVRVEPTEDDQRLAPPPAPRTIHPALLAPEPKPSAPTDVDSRLLQRAQQQRGA